MAHAAIRTFGAPGTVSLRSETGMASSSVSKASAAPQARFGNSFLSGTRVCTLSASRPAVARQALTIECGESRIGKQPVVVPKDVNITLKGQHLVVKGKKGQLERTFPDEIEVKQDGDNITFKKRADNLKSRQLHGLCRSLGNNMVVGVSEGYSKKLQLIGVGYRAAAQGKKLTLSLGYSHPVEMECPEGITAKCEGNTTIVIEGYDKSEVGNFAAIIRAKRPPEPYKGKGVRYDGEYVAIKEGKSGK